MWVGKPPKELLGLTRIEEKVLGLYRSCNFIIRLKYKTSYSSKYLQQRALVGNVISFAQNTGSTLRTLQNFPMPMDDLVDNVKIHFVGVTLPRRNQFKSILTVRRHKVLAAAKWLVQNNSLYTELR
eukprot:Lithocolla_globosa_v1_NODE_391_length_4199_cov_7.277027.p3 type:complete len:126 gc:universal NODE_391_length_4199_cov_7.277027:2781-2404(-)